MNIPIVPREVDILPPDIRELIKRKSSRDPSSRFANKLHILLSFAGKDPNIIEYIGAGWISDSLFKINKKRFCIVMDIKLNTLNVNLRDLGFQQMSPDKGGWTEWSRNGFYVSSTLNDLAEITSDKSGGKDSDKSSRSAPDDTQSTKISTLREIAVGKCDNEVAQKFRRFTISIWDELCDGADDKTIFTLQEFVQLAAQRFRIHKQKVSNAAEVIQAIFTCADPNQITILDFAKFMAKFGPEETLMEKVGSIVSSSNRNGNWLHVTSNPQSISNEQKFYGYFDENEHNCIILVSPRRGPTRVWNKVDVAASTGKYLVDDKGMEYDSWDNYFSINKIDAPEPAFPVPIYEW